MMTDCARLDCLEVKFSLQVSGQSPTTSPSARLEMLVVAGSGPLGAGVSAGVSLLRQPAGVWPAQLRLLRPAVQGSRQRAVQAAAAVQPRVRRQVWPGRAGTSLSPRTYSYRQQCVTVTETECDRVPQCSLVNTNITVTGSRQS